jgi:putative membrane protein
MWSWWDCVQWWNSVGDGTVPWLMFLPMMLWPIAVIGGIAALVMLIIRNGRTETQPNWRPDSRRQSPFEILSERFARGEIDRQEYEERKGFLSQR